MAMVNNIAQTVASKDLRLEETVTIVDPNTHLKGVQHMTKNVIIIKRRTLLQMLSHQSSISVFTS